MFELIACIAFGLSIVANVGLAILVAVLWRAAVSVAKAGMAPEPRISNGEFGIQPGKPEVRVAQPGGLVGHIDSNGVLTTEPNGSVLRDYAGVVAKVIPLRRDPRVKTP